MTAPSETPSLPPHRVVHVDLGPRSYDVVIGKGLLNYLDDLIKEKGLSGTSFLIADQNVAIKWSDVIERSLRIAPEATYQIFSGEASKALSDRQLMYELEGLINDRSVLTEARAVKIIKALRRLKKLIYKQGPLNNYTEVISKLAQARISRTGLIIALGGGVVGDLVGFIAATYMRGINFVQVPTTLLAMVDSSVGGKTGVNLPEGKNLVGAFHQPKLVVADLDTLRTLPAKEFAAGMAEVIKYGAIRDKALFDRVAKGVKPEDADLDVIVETCVAIKARIVENDEFETKGERALLNFGHTIGHAIEKATGYKTYLHGEAISLGMRAAAWLSVWHAGLPEAEARRIEAALVANALPTILKPEVDRAAILGALGNDKKVAADGQNRWVLLKSLGEATSGWELPSASVEKAIGVIR